MEVLLVVRETGVKVGSFILRLNGREAEREESENEEKKPK
jgi:hypothetical protein